MRRQQIAAPSFVDTHFNVWLIRPGFEEVLFPERIELEQGVEPVLTFVREQAVRLVHECHADHPSLWAAVESIAPKIGCVPSTRLDWVKHTETDSGQRLGTTASVAQRIKEL